MIKNKKQYTNIASQPSLNMNRKYLKIPYELPKNIKYVIKDANTGTGIITLFVRLSILTIEDKK